MMLSSWNRKSTRRRIVIRSISVILILFLLLLLFGFEEEETKQKKLLVGAAASLRPAMEDLLELYQKQKPDIAVNITYASSGTLEQQIRQGAPMDIYFSAALENMNSLSKDQLINDETMVELLENQIVLIEPKDSKLNLKGFEDIKRASRLAIGDPFSVPAGKYAYEVFEFLNLWEQAKDRATYGKDVTEVLAWVSSGNVDAGVVYATDAVLSDKIRIVAQAPEKSHSRIIYPVSVIKGSKEIEAAKEFINFLKKPEAANIFREYGFVSFDSSK